jgi:hypothetical protein
MSFLSIHCLARIDCIFSAFVFALFCAILLVFHVSDMLILICKVSGLTDDFHSHTTLIVFVIHCDVCWFSLLEFIIPLPTKINAHAMIAAAIKK